MFPRRWAAFVADILLAAVSPFFFPFTGRAKKPHFASGRFLTFPAENRDEFFLRISTFRGPRVQPMVCGGTVLGLSCLRRHFSALVGADFI